MGMFLFDAQLSAMLHNGCGRTVNLEAASSLCSLLSTGNAATEDYISLMSSPAPRGIRVHAKYMHQILRLQGTSAAVDGPKS